MIGTIVMLRRAQLNKRVDDAAVSESPEEKRNYMDRHISHPTRIDAMTIKCTGKLSALTQARVTVILKPALKQLVQALTKYVVMYCFSIWYVQNHATSPCSKAHQL